MENRQQDQGAVCIYISAATLPHTDRLLKKIIRKVWGRQGTQGLALLGSRLLGSGKAKATSQEARIICLHSVRSFASDPQQLKRLELVSTDL